LDPLATGLLAICLGEATKYSQDLFNSDKTYITTVFFGVKTDTGDSEGKILCRSQEPSILFQETFSDQLEQILPRFKGKIAQVPPMYSAIKKDGRPLYAYAREGEMFDLEAREVTISELEVLSVSWPIAVLRVSCSKGTYIRSLVSDIGDALGCGAHMTELRRTRIGHLSIDQAQTTDRISSDTKLMEVDSLISHIPYILLEHHLALRMKMGQRIHLSDVFQEIPPEIRESTSLRIYHLHYSPDQFMGLVDVKNGVLHPKRLLATDRLENLLEQSSIASPRTIDISIKHHERNSNF
jgi:tRNA pseudouridine55 synthase